MKWYENDWLVSVAFVALCALALVGNYYYHGGHIVW